MNRRRTYGRAPTGTFWRYWLPVLVYIVLIFGASSISTLRPPQVVSGSDKLAHIIEYGILGFLLMRAFLGTGFVSTTGKGALLGIVVGLLVALADELYQIGVPGRLSDPLDFAADALGLVLSGVLILILEQMMVKRR
jgi:VanZ family protein